jgi:DNA polymerase III psi subunit
MSSDYLPYFITEELYLVKENVPNEPVGKDNVEKPDSNPSTEENDIQTPIHHSIIVVTGSISSEDHSLLTKVLEAVKVNIGDTHLLTTAPEMHITFDKMMVFDDNATQARYEPSPTKQGDVLYSRSLSSLHSSKEEKIKLWNALKSWFNI